MKSDSLIVINTLINGLTQWESHFSWKLLVTCILQKVTASYGARRFIPIITIARLSSIQRGACMPFLHL